ncbi:MAG: hypothetical protein ACLTMP_08265 [Eggerthella lenta]
MKAVCSQFGIGTDAAFGSSPQGGASAASPSSCPSTLCAAKSTRTACAAACAIDEGNGAGFRCIWAPQAWNDYTRMKSEDIESRKRVKALIRTSRERA